VLTGAFQPTLPCSRAGAHEVNPTNALPEYVEFSFVITEALKRGENDLVAALEDPTDNPDTGGPTAPQGKIYPVDAASKAWFTRWVCGLYHDLWANTDQTGQTGDSYSQITDVEAEEDGLISYDRALWKVDAGVVSKAVREERSI
jgi:hypothetical protein